MEYCLESCQGNIFNKGIGNVMQQGDFFYILLSSNLDRTWGKFICLSLTLSHAGVRANIATWGGVDSSPPLENTPGSWYEYFLIHPTWDTYIETHRATFLRSILKNLDVTDLQTFAIIWSQVISTRHNKGNMKLSAKNSPSKLNGDTISN